MAPDDLINPMNENLYAPQLGIEERQRLISNHPLFAHLSLQETTELARLMFEVKRMANDIIVRQGDLVDTIYFIAHGTAEVTKTTDKNAVIFLATLHPNDVIGLSEKGYFAPSGIRTATVTASSAMLLLGLKVADFYQFLHKHPNFNAETQTATELMMRMNFIREVTSFVHLSLGRLRWLAQHLEKIAVPKDTIIFKQGEHGDKCYVIYSGEVEISAYDATASDNKKVLALLHAPMLFGETALFTSSPRNATAKASNDCILFAIKRKDLLELTAMEENANRAVRSIIAERCRPLRTPNIKDYHSVTAEGENIVTLKNPVNNHYYRLTQEGWFIWQRINGQYSLRKITRAFAKKFKDANPDIVPAIIFNLANAGFVQIASLNINTLDTQPALANPKKWWLSVILLFIIISAGIFLYFNVQHNRKPHIMASSASLNSIAPIVTQVLAIDLVNQHNISIDQIRNGNIPILIIHKGNDPNDHSRDVISFANQFAELLFLDNDKNGRIDMSDGIFSRLELLFLSPDPTKIRRLPITAAGIRAFVLNKPEFMRFANSNQPDKFSEVENSIIMANGSTRQVQVVPVDQQILP